MRLMLKRPLSDVWLDLDVDYSDITYTEVHNGPGDITARLPMSYNMRRAEDGALVIGEYETLMIVENGYDGLVVALVDSVEISERDLIVSGAGVSVLAKGTPWLGDVEHCAGKDALWLFRRIWDYISSFQQADLGMTIKGDTTSGRTVGEPPSAAYIKAQGDLAALERELTSRESALKTREDTLVQKTTALFKAAGLHSLGQVKMQASAPSETRNIIWIETDNLNQTKVYKDGKWTVVTGQNPKIQDWIWHESYRTLAAKNVKDTKAKLAAAKQTLTDLAGEDGEAYDLNSWQTLDLSQKLSDLVDIGGFEYVERARWGANDSLELSLEVGAPRIGARREDLVFELGVNVVDVPMFRQTDAYTDVLMIGAGEGSTTLRTHQMIRDTPRVRRVKVITDKDATTRDQVRQASRREIAPYKKKMDFIFDSVTVRDHAWARPSQYDVGDEIRITGETPTGMYFDRWVRILEKTVSSSSEDIILKVEVV